MLALLTEWVRSVRIVSFARNLPITLFDCAEFMREVSAQEKHDEMVRDVDDGPKTDWLLGCP